MYYKHTQDKENSITIRLAGAEDADAIRRLAERDTAEVPEGVLLVGFSGDEARAAVSVHSGESVSDPFHPTGELLGLVATRAAQLRGDGRGLRAKLGRALGRKGSARAGRGAFSPQPAGTLRPH